MVVGFNKKDGSDGSSGKGQWYIGMVLGVDEWLGVVGMVVVMVVVIIGSDTVSLIVVGAACVVDDDRHKEVVDTRVSEIGDRY